MVMDEYVPGKSHLFDLDTEKKKMHILYKDYAGRGWRIQCVPVAPRSFKSRNPLLEAWRGLRAVKLSEASSIDGSVFVHPAASLEATRRLRA